MSDCDESLFLDPNYWQLSTQKNIPVGWISLPNHIRELGVDWAEKWWSVTETYAPWIVFRYHRWAVTLPKDLALWLKELGFTGWCPEPDPEEWRDEGVCQEDQYHDRYPYFPKPRRVFPGINNILPLDDH